MTKILIESVLNRIEWELYVHLVKGNNFTKTERNILKHLKDYEESK